MKHPRLTAFAAVFSALLLPQTAKASFANNPMTTTSIAAIQEGFIDPPLRARAGAFWPWLNANVDRDRLRYELQQMKEKGMSGPEIWDVQAMRNGHMVPAGPEFLSPESVANIRYALAEAKKLGLRMGMITSSGWNAGGTWVSPDWAGKTLVHSFTVTTGPATYSGQLPFPALPPECPLAPNGLPQYYREVAVLAVRTSADNTVTTMADIINLSRQMQPDGHLTWEVPDGSWHILRFVCTNTGQTLIVPSPKSNGLFIDFLDPNATRRHLQTIMDRLGITPDNAAEVGLSYLEVDSMELHEGTPWTDAFPTCFKQYRGYDPTNFLPALAGYTIVDKSTSEAFLYDFRNTVSDLLIHSHYETGSEFLARYGIDFVGEAGGPGPPIWNTCPVDALKALGNVTIPRGEFWIQHRNMFLIKEIASAAHIYGKPVVDAESWTTWRRWEDAPAALKVHADRAFSEGLNHITIHTFAHSPDAAGLPGWTYHAGIDINPNVTWWPFARPFFDYLARCSWMLRQGLPVSDVLWYYGDQAPNFFPTFHNVPEKPRLPGLNRGYDFDVVNSDVILNRLQVKDGQYTLPEGTTYRVLAIAPDAAVPLEVLDRLHQFVHQGGILLGAPPSLTTGFHNEKDKTTRLHNLSVTLWGDTPSTGSRTVGTGKVYYGLTLDELLKAENIAPDFVIEDKSLEKNIDFIHRRTLDADIYFVCNQSDAPTSFAATFRTSRPAVHRWDPIDGDIASTSAVNQSGSHTRINIQLPPGGSNFFVFSDTPLVAAEAPVTTAESLPITGPWELSFPPDSGAPTSITLGTLRPWNEFKRKGIRYFSGTATYTTTVTVPAQWPTPAAQIHLDLGVVNDVAEVSINGRQAGITWTPPHQVNITSLLHPGENVVTVKIANLWHNRLVGDASLPEDKRVTKTNNPYDDKKEAALKPSGLIGPVTLTLQDSPSSNTAPSSH